MLSAAARMPLSRSDTICAHTPYHHLSLSREEHAVSSSAAANLILGARQANGARLLTLEIIYYCSFLSF
jgi:hypothetical protein